MGGGFWPGYQKKNFPLFAKGVFIFFKKNCLGGGQKNFGHSGALNFRDLGVLKKKR